MTYMFHCFFIILQLTLDSNQNFDADEKLISSDILYVPQKNLDNCVNNTKKI